MMLIGLFFTFFCTMLQLSRLSTFKPTPQGMPSTLRTVRSNCMRPDTENQVLLADGDSVRIVELSGGVLSFYNSVQIIDYIEDIFHGDSSAVSHIVLDFIDVKGITYDGVKVLAEVYTITQETGTSLVLSRMSADVAVRARTYSCTQPCLISTFKNERK